MKKTIKILFAVFLLNAVGLFGFMQYTKYTYGKKQSELKEKIAQIESELKRLAKQSAKNRSALDSELPYSIVVLKKVDSPKFGVKINNISLIKHIVDKKTHYYFVQIDANLRDKKAAAIFYTLLRVHPNKFKIVGLEKNSVKMIFAVKDSDLKKMSAAKKKIKTEERGFGNGQ